VTLDVYGFSHPGKVRKINEDSWRFDLDLGLFVVADGMGGHNAGDVASEMAVEAIFAFMQHTMDSEDATWPFGFDPNTSIHANRVRTAIKLANRRVFRSAEASDEYSGMGTTAVVVYLDDARLVCGSVGDSRVYSMMEGTLEQLTADDSWIRTLQEANPDGADLTRHPMRHVLTKVVGARDELDVQVVERPFATGQTLLLCSDGLHGELGDQQIAELLATGDSARDAVESLIEAVLRGRARDNVTALVVRT